MKYKIFTVPFLILINLMILGSGCSGADKTGFKQQTRENKTMSDIKLLDYGDYDAMLPLVTYNAGNYMRYVFAVPENNMVGTNELDNAIKLLEFKDDGKLEQHIVKKDFMEMVTGPFEFRFLPVWSDKEIAYSQSKGFLLVNISDKKVEMHTISPGMYAGDIENLTILDKSNKTFVFEIDKPYAKVQGFKKLLQVIRFENGAFNVLAEHPAGIKTGSYTEPWFVYQKKIFIYKDSTTELEVFDEYFKPTTHPLAEAFNQNRKTFRRLQEIVVHPSLPFALIIEMGKDQDPTSLEMLPPEQKVKALTLLYEENSRRTLFLFRWQHEDKKQRFIPLLAMNSSVWNTYNPIDNYSGFHFSPDGKWCVFRDYTGNYKNPVFVAIPINEKNPLLLGKPLKLGNAVRSDAIGPTGTAWTTNPTAFVMCDGMLLYHWNLDIYDQISMQKIKMPPNAPDPFVKRED
jgi:hypothetical protein